jgi:hypothetical protein
VESSSKLFYRLAFNIINVAGNVLENSNMKMTKARTAMGLQQQAMEMESVRQVMMTSVMQEVTGRVKKPMKRSFYPPCS